MRAVAVATALFPVWALLISAAAYMAPAPFAAGSGLIVPLLVLIMFAMGATLTPADFARALRRPLPVTLGVALQYLLMPALAWTVSYALALPPELAVGMILVGSVSGGTASNVICYLARGDVALSISMTAVSTLLAVAATPALTWLYAGRVVPVPVADMFASIASIVLLPVAAGVALNTLAGARLDRIKGWLPLLSVAAIVAVIGVIVGLNRDAIAAVGPAVAAGVVLHNACGLAAGYGLAWLMLRDPVTARTVAIEVGMQNSGLAVALATQYFSAAAALPGALFSVWHNISGSLLAAWWSRASAVSR